MTLPVEVMDAVRDGRCLVFAGSRFGAECRERDGLPTASGMALARSLGWKKPRPRPGRAPAPVTPSIRDAAESFEALHGRTRLLAHMQEWVGVDELEPNDAHRFFVEHFDLIFTTVWDDLFEKAATEVGRPFRVLTRNDSIPEVTKDQPVLIRLRGGFSSGPIITHSDEQGTDWDEAARNRLRQLIRKNVILFVGYRPDEEEFEALFEQLTLAYGASLPRCHLAVSQGRIDDYQWQRWVWKGLLLFTADPQEAAEALQASIQ